MADYGVVTEAGAIRFERLLPGPIETVWAWLTESDKRARWLASGEMEMRAGSEFELVWRNSELSGQDDPTPAKYADFTEHRMKGHIVSAEPPRLLIHDWDDGDGKTSEVMWELAERGERVLLTLTHRRLSDRATMVDVAGGWHTHLGILEAKLEGREPPLFWAPLAGLEAEYERRVPVG